MNSRTCQTMVAVVTSLGNTIGYRIVKLDSTGSYLIYNISKGELIKDHHNNGIIIRNLLITSNSISLKSGQISKYTRISLKGKTLSKPSIVILAKGILQTHQEQPIFQIYLNGKVSFTTPYELMALSQHHNIANGKLVFPTNRGAYISSLEDSFPILELSRTQEDTIFTSIQRTFKSGYIPSELSRDEMVQFILNQA